MAIRQELKARLTNLRKGMKGGGQGYVDRCARNSGSMAVRNGDGETYLLKSLIPDCDPSLRVNLAEVEKNNALRICVQSDESHVAYSKVYLAPLPETGGKEYFLSFGDFIHEGKPVMALAADFFNLYNFETYNKYYLLSPEDKRFGNEEQLIFDGIAELAAMDGYTVPANPLSANLCDVKRGFEPINEEYKIKGRLGLNKRRNLIVLPVEE